MTRAQHTPAAQERRETPRIRLARVASAAAAATPSVTGLDSGPSGIHATFAGSERLPGVTVAATEDGRYGVALHLTAEPTDLRALAAAIDAAIRSRVDAAGLGESLGELHLTFTDLTIPSQN